MLNLKSKKQGFTIIELLVAIAIIGILSSVILVSLSDARKKARLGRVQSQMSGLHPHLVICVNDETNLTSGTPTGGSTVMCSGSTGIFPSLPTNWAYGANVTAYASASYRATGEGKTVVCTETGCVTTP